MLLVSDNFKWELCRSHYKRHQSGCRIIIIVTLAYISTWNFFLIVDFDGLELWVVSEREKNMMHLRPKSLCLHSSRQPSKVCRSLSSATQFCESGDNLDGILCDLVKGKTNNVPQLSSKVVRVFISSTFSGLFSTFSAYTSYLGVRFGVLN